MAVSDDKKPVLSPAMVQFIRRRAMEISGLTLVFLGIALLIALASAGNLEPSFNRVSDAPVQNLLGVFGANISSLLFSGAGLAAFLFALTPIFWGFHYFRKQPVSRPEWRLFFWPVSVALVAAGLFGLDGGNASDNGGALGAVLVGIAMRFLHPMPPFLGFETIHYVGGSFVFVGAVLWMWVSALSQREWVVLGRRFSRYG